ncbi:hypothetical protein DMA12_02625 [Amycolatopsis balhimycina DSM 5908]|uniref:PPE domain-containing protein n=1 Tax=Amycolatopsis balhimycina DSM 5908 TaxID=1081091 RepID=A0A428X4A5_AMYBA|nr:hypothetical protein [Amycolatopsis balhimycina]RSM50163.1 hypothetical protein DMA12_02625 [Amycolatopsis balhimycina DSM 5908]
MAEYTAQQIVDFLKSGDGPDSLFASSELAQQMAAKHVEARDMMTRLQSAMSEAWSGDAAAQAQAGAGPLLAASEVSAVHLAAAQNSLMTQGADYADLRNKVGDGPGPQPQEDFLSRTFPMLTDKDEQVAGWNAKAQEVVQHYGTYSGQSGDNAAGLPQDYGELTLPAGGADIEHAEKPAAVTPPAGRDDRRTDTTGRTTQVEHRDTDVPGQQQRQRTDTPSTNTPSTNTNVPGQQRPGIGQDDTTRTTGLTPVAHTDPGDGTTRPRPLNPGFGRDGGSGDINARLGPNVPVIDGPGGTGRFGTPGGEPGGGRSGSDPGRGGAGSGRGSEPGGRSGVGRFGEPGVARPGAAGAAGKPGAGAMGGPLGRGGEKEEDKEHKRLDILQELDPDELFGGFPDGMKPVPPTIGA